MPSVRWSDTQVTDFAARLRDARKRRGMTQKAAAAAIGVSQGTLSELERSANKSAHTARAAAVYGVNALWLQDGVGSMAPAAALHSQRAASVATRLDEITDPAEFAQACTICEAFAALAKAGQLATVAQQLSLVSPAREPRRAPQPDRRTHSGPDRRQTPA